MEIQSAQPQEPITFTDKELDELAALIDEYSKVDLEKIILTKKYFSNHIYSCIMNFILKYNVHYPMFCWKAFAYAYLPFMCKYIEMTKEDLDKLKDNFITISREKSGFKYILQLFDDLFLIQTLGFDIFEDYLLLRIQNPEWIQDLCIVGDSFRKKCIHMIFYQIIESAIITVRLNIEHIESENIKKLQVFINKHFELAPVFPWHLIEYVYYNFILGLENKTVLELEEYFNNIIIQILKLSNIQSHSYVSILINDLILIKKNSIEHFFKVLLIRILAPYLDTSWLYNLYQFTNVYKKMFT